MTNLPENENNQQVEEFSTIFSAPTQHEKTADNVKNKRPRIIVSLILVVAILFGGTFAVVKLIPEKEEKPIETTQETVLLDYSSDDIKNITVKNKNGKFNMYPETVKEQTEEGEETESTYWYLKGYDKDLTDSSLILQVVNSAINFSAIREITSKNEKDCGLENSDIKVDITTNKSEKVSVLIGSKSPDNAGAYVKVSNKEGIYLVGGDIDENLNFEDVDLANSNPQAAIVLDDKYADYYNGDALSRFDKLTLSSVNFTEEVVFVPNDNELFKAFMPYNVLKPVKRDARDVDSLFYLFTNGFNVSGAYSYDVSDKSIKALGLDKPDCVLSAKFGDYTYSYKFKKQADGDYAFIGNDSKNIKRVTDADCGFLNSTSTDYYNTLIWLVSIENLKNLTVKTEDNSYSFDIAANPSENDDDKYIVECDGKNYKSAYFQSFYQYLCMLEAMEFAVEDISEKPEITLIYSYNDKNNTKTKIEFVKASATKYQYSIDGVALGKVSSSSVKKILKNLERLLDGKSITVN